MNQKNLISLIILDTIVIFFALGLIFLRYRSLTTYSNQPLAELYQTKQKSAAAPVANILKQPSEQNRDTGRDDAKTRNIGFSFRNSKVKKVALIGSFNNWVPQPLVKGANHTWKASLPLTPGEYAYNFVIDGRPVRDPSNAKISNAGRGFASSYLKVNPVK